MLHEAQELSQSTQTQWATCQVQNLPWHDEKPSTHLRCPCRCSCHPSGGSRHCQCLQGYHSRCQMGWCPCCQPSGGWSRLCCLCGDHPLQPLPGHQLQWLWKLSCLMSRLCAQRLHKQTGRSVQLRENGVDLLSSHIGDETQPSGSCWLLQHAEQQLSSQHVSSQQRDRSARGRLLTCWRLLSSMAAPIRQRHDSLGAEREGRAGLRALRASPPVQHLLQHCDSTHLAPQG